MEKFKIVAKTFHGLEDVLAEEVRKIGGEDIEKETRAVTYMGDKKLLYRSNFCLRTAIRILKPILSFKASNENEFYSIAKKFQWDEYFGLKQTFSIDPVVNSALFPHSRYIALKLKDAIVDQFREKYGKRPYISTETPHIKFNLYIHEDEVVISLDSSGVSLHKRGYKKYNTEAPLNEALAAGLILLSEWDKKSVFIDPMCGSGTLPIEAALIAFDIPPGVYRDEYSFEKWTDFDAELFQEIYDEETEEEENTTVEIIGCDMSPKAIRIANENIKNAGLSKRIQLYNTPIEKLSPPETHGVVIINPPYGERMNPRELTSLYKGIGDRLKKEFEGYTAWIITSSKIGMKNIELHPSKRITLYNGALECKFQKFELYEGSRKIKKEEEEEK